MTRSLAKYKLGFGTSNRYMRFQPSLLFAHQDVPAALRYELGDDHVYDYADGMVLTSISPGTFTNTKYYSMPRYILLEKTFRWIIRTSR
jgi:hypothetical protein